MHRRRKRGGRAGIYPPLVWAAVFLLAATLVWAWQQVTGPRATEEGTLRIEPIQPTPGVARPLDGSVSDRDIVLYDAQEKAERKLPLEEYLVGVVAAEMPAAFAEEALRAQAVAARTRTVAGLRALGGAGCARHPGADICSDSTHCQAWESQAQLRDRWGTDYDAYAKKITAAVEDTRCEILTYAGAPILVLYHAVSGGATEDVEHVFAQALPYLRGVESPGEEGAARYESEQRFSYAWVVEKLNQALPKAELKVDNLSKGLQVLERFDSGRVGKVRVGKTTADGRAIRTALGLYSTNFTFSFEPQEVLVSQRGYGHGVGMSQVGADAMARAGSRYAEILRHFYTGVVIERW